MYVLSSLPKAQQSTAGGIFNTMLQLAQATGLGLSTAIYNAIVVEDNGKQKIRLNGFRAVFWFTCGIAAFTVIFVPFLTLRRQGELKKEGHGEKAGDEEARAKVPQGVQEVLKEDIAQAGTEYDDEVVLKYPATPPDAHVEGNINKGTGEAC
jgi:hypothetical protein